MTLNRRDSSLRRDTVAFAGVLMNTLELCTSHRVLTDRLSHRALDLLEAVTLALARIGDMDREERLIDADVALQSTRCLLRMTHDLDLIDDDTYLGFVEQADSVGRQIGSWLNHLTAVG